MNLPSLRLLKECHRLWKQFSKRHAKMFALIKASLKKVSNFWDEYLEGNRTHLIYSCMFDKKSIPLFIFTLYSWKELKCFWLNKEGGIRIVCSIPPFFQRFKLAENRSCFFLIDSTPILYCFLHIYSLLEIPECFFSPCFINYCF